MTTTTITQKGVLANAKIRAVLSTRDPKRSREFYESRLGLRVGDTNDERGETYYEGADSTQLLVYAREAAPKAENTAAAFEVVDLDKVITALRANGVRFEEYDMPGLKTVNGVVDMDGWRGAFLKDPDGNILGIGETR
jgi:catechol 2,3-dioxygenase-like lactoylglutathione lyase family enzyme